MVELTEAKFIYWTSLSCVCPLYRITRQPRTRDKGVLTYNGSQTTISQGILTSRTPCHEWHKSRPEIRQRMAIRNRISWNFTDYSRIFNVSIFIPVNYKISDEIFVTFSNVQIPFDFVTLFRLRLRVVTDTVHQISVYRTKNFRRRHDSTIISADSNPGYIL